MRRLLPVLIALNLGAPLASAAPAPAKPALAGTVKLSSKDSVTIDVRLPKPIDLGQGWIAPTTWTLTGAGRVTGIVMTDTAYRGPSLVFLKYQFCVTVGCTTKQPAISFRAQDGRNQGGNQVLPAGDYRLTLVTDGAPVSVMLKLPGLAGATTLKPTRKVAVNHMVPDYTPVDAGAPFDTAYSGAVGQNLDAADGFVLHQFQTTVGKMVQRSSTFCTYQGATEYPPGPTCPGGYGNEITVTQVYTEGERYSRLYGFHLPIHQGAQRAGHFWRTVGQAHDPLGVITWVALPPR